MIILCYSALKGEHLTRGIKKEDLRMTIGDGECVVTSLTDTRVDCRPPADKPTKNADDTRCDGDTMSQEASHTVFSVRQSTNIVKCAVTNIRISTDILCRVFRFNDTGSVCVCICKSMQCGPALHYSVDLKVETYTGSVLLEYGKLATKCLWI